MKKLQTAIAVYQMPINAMNPWGDFDRILALTTRLEPEEDVKYIGTITPSNYFKVHRITGFLTPITEDEFKDACVALAIQGVLPHLVTL